ncbi:MAG: four helix bundle protein [Verrucomicrobia bacterium]|nr:MAG: four helix bundle protein [Verrucomicrobiota bacterium]
MAYQSFEDLEVWQRGCRLSVGIYNAFDKCRKFSLKDQIERAGLSIPSNIAEGAERGSTKDFAHFLNYSKGSCGELRTQLYIARKLKAVAKSDFENLIAETKEISAMLQGLRRSLLRESASQDETRSQKAPKT